MELQVFAESRDAESGVVDQHVDPPVVAHDFLNRSREAVELGDVEPPHLDFVGDARLPGCLLQASLAAQVAHGGDDPIAI